MVIEGYFERMAFEYGLETVDFDLLLLGQSDGDEPVADFGPLISLELKHLAVLRVLHYCPIAGKFLLACAGDSLEVIVRGETLDACERFPVVPLLDPDVD